MGINAVLVGRGTSNTTGPWTSSSGTTQVSGSTFVICVSYDAGATSATPTDSKSNVYTRIGTAVTTGNGDKVEMWKCENGTGGAGHTATQGFGGFNNFSVGHLIEITGATLTPFDVTNQGTDASSPFTVTTPTLNQADELILTLCAANAGVSTTNTYSSSNTTIISQEPDGSTFWTSAVSALVVSSTTAVTPSFTAAQGTASGLVVGTFRAAPVVAAIRQGATSQSNPGGTFTNPGGLLLPAATLSGSTIIVAFGNSAFAGTRTFTCTDTLGQTYTQIDYLTHSNDYNFAVFACQNSQVLPAATAVTFTASVSSGASSATLTSAWAGSTRTYVIKFSTGETRVTPISNGATAITWGDGLGQAATSSASIGYGPYVTSSSDEDFMSCSVLEIQNVPTSGVVVAHNALVQTGITSGANKLNPGSLACGTGSGLLLMISACTANGAGSPGFVPVVGTSPVAFTLFSSFWDYGSGKNQAIWQSAHLSAPGTITPTAGATETASDDYYSAALFLADAGSTAPAQFVDRPNAPRPGRGPFSKGRFHVSDTTAYTLVSTGVTTSLTGQAASFSAGALSPSTSVGMTGKAATFAAGALVAVPTKGLSGQAGTFAAGTVTPNSSLALTGQSGPFTAGTVTPGLSLSLTGIAGTFAAGTLIATPTKGLTGQVGTFASGTLVPNMSVGLTGQLATFLAGTMSTGADVTVSLNGQIVSFTAGLLVPNSAVALTGQSSAFSTGTMTAASSIVSDVENPSRPRPGRGPFSKGRFHVSDTTAYTTIPSTAVFVSLTGSVGTFNAGVMTPSSAVAVTGQPAVFGLGTLLAANSQGLTGTGSTFATGALVPNTSVGLTGQSGIFAAGTVGAQGSVTVNLTGQAANFTAGILAPSTTLVATGQLTSFATGTLIANLSVSLLGRSATVSTGALIPGFAIPLAGQSASFISGLLQAPTDKVVALTGSVSTFASGILLPNGFLVGGPRYIIRRLRMRSFVVSSNTYLEFPPLDPDESYPLTFDATVDLPTGVTLSGTPTVIIRDDTGRDANPSAIQAASAAFDASLVRVIVPVGHGKAGSRYRIKVESATTQANIFWVLTGILPVVEGA